MQIRDTHTAYRLEAAADEAGELKLIVSWGPLHKTTPRADDVDQVKWLIQQLRKCGVCVLVPRDLRGFTAD